jgi:uncharacterized protein with PQ loop repeat
MIDFLIRNSGWIGICLGQLVPWFQIIKIYKSKKSSDVSIGTYVFLVAALFFYLTHAIDIKDPAFITAQALALFSNGLALFLIIKYK